MFNANCMPPQIEAIAWHHEFRWWCSLLQTRRSADRTPLWARHVGSSDMIGQKADFQRPTHFRDIPGLKIDFLTNHVSDSTSAPPAALPHNYSVLTALTRHNVNARPPRRVNYNCSAICMRFYISECLYCALRRWIEYARSLFTNSPLKEIPHCKWRSFA